MKPVVKFHSRGESGNIFAIMGSVKKALEDCGRLSEYWELQARIFRSESYERALHVMREKVDLIDLDKKY